MKTAIINARVKPDLKNEVEEILSRLGITTTQAITMYFEQIKMNQGIPFQLKIPTDETIQAMKDARANKDMEEVTIDQLKASLSQLQGRNLAKLKKKVTDVLDQVSDKSDLPEWDRL